LLQTDLPDRSLKSLLLPKCKLNAHRECNEAAHWEMEALEHQKL